MLTGTIVKRNSSVVELPQDFVNKAVSTAISDFQQTLSLIIEALYTERTSNLLGMRATLDKITYHSCELNGVTDKDDRGKFQFHKGNAPRILKRQSVVISWEHLTEYQATQWQDGYFKAPTSKKTVHKNANKLRALGIINYKDVPPRYKASKHGDDWRSPLNRFFDIDVIGCVLAGHAIDILLFGRAKKAGLENPLDALPKHKGAHLTFVHNSLLGCVQDLNRLDPDAGWKTKIPEAIRNALSSTLETVRNGFTRVTGVVNAATESCTGFGWLKHNVRFPSFRKREDSDVKTKKKNGFLAIYKDAGRTTPKAPPKTFGQEFLDALGITEVEATEKIGSKELGLILIALFGPMDILPTHSTLEACREDAKEQLRQWDLAKETYTGGDPDADVEHKFFLMRHINTKRDGYIYRPCPDYLWEVADSIGVNNGWEVVGEYSNGAISDANSATHQPVGD